MTFYSTIQSLDKPLILDGAMGTEIEKLYGPSKSVLWSAEILFQKPEVVENIHKEYLKAGADIIITNTFRTSPYSFRKAGYSEREAEKYLNIAVDLASSAMSTFSKRKIFGSIASLEDCFRPDLVPKNDVLRRFHSQTLKVMDQREEIDLILFETINSYREIKEISSLIDQFDHPIGISVTLNNQGNLLDGTSIKKVLEFVSQHSFQLFGLNCASPNVITKGVRKISSFLKQGLPTIVYANLNQPDPITGQVTDNFTVETYANESEIWLQEGIDIIGSCCGTTSELTKQLALKYK